ncbi:fimbrial protein [Citrobacter arsenatis]|uniref:fimbrial protein n=1 Tax=Citrobacter arsenatis TaxID=2546350 RepID=UPI00300E26F5
MITLPHGHAATATATVVINATFTMPPCTLTMPATVQLGGLNTGTGTATHSPVKIDIDCPDGENVETALYAQHMSGVLSGTDKMTMVPGSGTTSGTPALFWLKESGGATVRLDGTGADIAGNAFCRGTAVKRSCTLTPVTQVFADTVREEVGATVRFNVMYP